MARPGGEEFVIESLALLKALKVLDLGRLCVDAMRLLKRLPGLRRLYVHEVEPPSSLPDTVVDNSVLSTSMQVLKSNSGLYFGPLLQLLTRLPLLEDLSCAWLHLYELPDLTHLDVSRVFPETLKALWTSCPNLESLVKGPLYLSMNEFEAAREEAICDRVSRLQHVDAVQYEIEADMMLKTAWPCKGLKTLRCRIVGVNRLSQEEQDLVDAYYQDHSNSSGDPDSVRQYGDVDDRTTAALERQWICRQQQEQVYNKLAQLTDLQVLDLGAEWRDFRLVLPALASGEEPGPTIDFGLPNPLSLELSLASGVAQLSALQKLEVFGFEGVNHRICREELEKMAGWWPRLKMMRGFQIDLFSQYEKEDKNKTELRKYMMTLRPDVEHEQAHAKIDELDEGDVSFTL
ncbi:hypothetical protein BGW39_000664 [Mortierella sp. 14UC]|nr:hypothetical protein BGW39_000664 [Mortierella sp. 14UC]